MANGEYNETSEGAHVYSWNKAANRVLSIVLHWFCDITHSQYFRSTAHNCVLCAWYFLSWCVVPLYVFVSSHAHHQKIASVCLRVCLLLTRASSPVPLRPLILAGCHHTPNCFLTLGETFERCLSLATEIDASILFASDASELPFATLCIRFIYKYSSIYIFIC